MHENRSRSWWSLFQKKNQRHTETQTHKVTYMEVAPPPKKATSSETDNLSRDSNLS